MAPRKPVRIGDDPEFQKAFRAVARKVLGRGPSKFPFRCQRCLDRGYVVTEVSANGKKWTMVSACSGQIMDKQVGLRGRCPAADKPVFMARVNQAQKPAPKPANSSDIASGSRSTKAPAEQQPAAPPVYRTLTLRDVLPSEQDVASWQYEVPALFPQADSEPDEPARRLEVSEKAVDDVIAQVDDLISQGEDEAAQVDVMIDLINEEW